MRKFALLTAVSLGLSLMAGCFPPPPTSPYEFDQTDNGTTQTIRTRSYVNITIPGNPTTGYTWQLSSISNPWIVQSIGSSYTPNSTTLVGSPGVYVFSFQVTGYGTSTITLTELPPGSQTPSSVYTLTLVAQ